jgi:hypothetical protein
VHWIFLEGRLLPGDSMANQSRFQCRVNREPATVNFVLTLSWHMAMQRKTQASKNATDPQGVASLALGYLILPRWGVHALSTRSQSAWMFALGEQS